MSTQDGYKQSFETEHFRIKYQRIKRSPNCLPYYIENGVKRNVWEKGEIGTLAEQAIMLHEKQCMVELEEGKKNMLEANIRYQERHFKTFLLPVPEDAKQTLAHDCPFPGCTFPESQRVLFIDKYGYTISDKDFLSLDNVPQPVCISFGVPKPCDESLIEPWLREMVQKFGALAFYVGASPNMLLDDIFTKRDIPLATAQFRMLGNPPLFAYIIRIDNACVVVHSDCIKNIIKPNGLTPWSRALLERADAHEILLEVIDVLNKQNS